MGPWPIVSDDPQIQANYEEARELGTSHTLAEMFALAEPPGSKTDKEFLQGHCNGSQFADKSGVGDIYKRQAEAAGVNVKGKVYVGGLAEYPGDPKAWVDSRGDVQRVCEERGWGARGDVNVTIQEQEPKTVDLAEDLIDAEVDRIVADAEVKPGERIDTEDLREQVRAKRKPHWAKR